MQPFARGASSQQHGVNEELYDGVNRDDGVAPLQYARRGSLSVRCGLLRVGR